MSNTLSGQNLGVFPYNLDGLQNIDVNSINGQQLDFSNLVQYRGNTDNLDMGPYNIQTAHPAAANNDVVNLLSLTSRMSALTGYILGINGLNYVPYTGGTANTILGSYGLSAGNITANSFLNVGGASVLSGNITAISNLNVNGLTTLARGQTNFTAASSLDIPNKAYVDSTITNAIASISVGSSILATNNIFTGINEFNNNVTTGLGYTTNLNGALSTSLNDLGFTSASFTTSGITGSYTPPLGTITNPSGSTYQITQTAQGRSVMAISGFAPSVLTTYIFQINIKCTIGTAILSVEQDNILRSPQYYQLSTSFNTITGTFYYDGNPNTIIFKIYAGVASWNAQWDSFTLSTYRTTISSAITASGIQSGTATSGLGLNGSNQVVRTALPIAPPNFSAVSVGSVPYESAVDTFSNSLITQGTASLGYSGASFTASTGIASITFASPTYTANSNASVQGIINATAIPTTYLNLPCIATLTNVSFPLFAVAPYPYFTLTSGATVVYTSAVGASGTITMPFTPTTSPLFITIFFKAPPTGVSVPVFRWDNFTITTAAMITTGSDIVSGNQIVGTNTINREFRKVGGNAGTNWMSMRGEDIGNSPYTEYFFNNLRRCYMGNATATSVQIAAENGTQLEFLTAGSLRVAVKANGTTTHTAGDSSYMIYGPNATWNANLIVGATPDKSGVATAQVITTNGNLHLDGGNSNAVYYGFYANQRGTPNSHQFYGNIFFGTAPAYISGGCSALSYSAGSPGQITRSNVVQRLVWYANSQSWASGVNATFAFYKAVLSEPVKLTGRFSHYVGGGGMSYPYIRIYSQSSGVYSYYSLQCYFNVTYNHTPQSIDLILQYQDIPYTGWFDVYFYNNGGCITDSNDFLWINATNLLATNY